jgi:hypothetical protein
LRIGSCGVAGGGHTRGGVLVQEIAETSNVLTSTPPALPGCLIIRLIIQTIRWD